MKEVFSISLIQKQNQMLFRKVRESFYSITWVCIISRINKAEIKFMISKDSFKVQNISIRFSINIIK
jgi:hypothetical protein